MTREEMLAAIMALPEEERLWTDVKQVLRNPEKCGDEIIRRVYRKRCEPVMPEYAAYTEVRKALARMDYWQREAAEEGEAPDVFTGIRDCQDDSRGYYEFCCQKIREAVEVCRENRDLALEWCYWTRDIGTASYLRSLD